MNILLCGASGFIGRHIHTALTAAGHSVMPARSQPSPGAIAVDFSRDTDPATWLPRLKGIDAVVNVVGVLRDRQRRPMQAIHADTPKALFDACAQAGVRRVIHVSALGIQGNPTRYAVTKLAAEQHLLALNQAGALDGVVLRPSVVFGRGGASSELFINLARLPLWLLPGPVYLTLIQPIAVGDLAQVVAQLLSASHLGQAGVLPCVGPEALSLGDFLDVLRAKVGHKPAMRLTLPQGLTRLSARLGDVVPISPWCSETLALLSQDNVAPVAQTQTLLGRPPMAPNQFNLQR